MRTFATGATRDTDENKPDLEGFLSPMVLDSFAAYMSRNRKQADGNLRDSDNWQKGIPIPAYMKSMMRHFMEVWGIHRGTREGSMEDALNALMFNVMGYQFEHLKQKAVPVESSYVGVDYAERVTIPIPPAYSGDWHSACGAASKEVDLDEAIEGIVAEAELSSNDGWIEWAPPVEVTEYPPLALGTVVEFKMRDGQVGGIVEHQAGGLRWTHEGVGSDIIAYRVKQSDDRYVGVPR